MEDFDNFEERTIVNGAYLRKFINKNVSVLLNVKNVAPGGKSIVGETTDKQKVNVVLTCPLNMPLNGWIEVIGVPLANGDNIRCTEIINFEQNDDDEAFDEDAHNMLVNCIHNCQNLYKVEE